MDGLTCAMDKSVGLVLTEALILGSLTRPENYLN